MLASGYLKVAGKAPVERTGRVLYELCMTNKEVRMMFEDMIQDWFSVNDDYHGFVLGLIVELADRYVITSNRESGFGRYDVMLEPKAGDCGIIMEFKVQEEEEKELADTVRRALKQIEEKQYQANLIARGIPEDRIRKYGFAFRGKKVLIGSAPD